MGHLQTRAFLGFLTSTLALAAPVGADVSGPPPETAGSRACLQAPCRSAPLRANLLSNDGTTQIQLSFDPAPYVVDGAITIFPGETLVFRFSGTSESPGTPVFVKEMAIPLPQKALPSDSSFQSDTTTSVEHDPKTGENLYTIRKGSPFAEGGTAEEHLKGEPGGTLILSYHQIAGHPDMALRIEHNFEKPLKYDATIEPVSARGLGNPEHSSTCPVHPLVAGMETWPYPLGPITLRDFRFLDTSKGFDCD
jgi:hypothetical protein